MSSEIAGYRVGEPLHRRNATVVYLGESVSSGGHAIVKIPNSDYPTPRALERLREEHDLLSAVESELIVRPLTVAQFGNSLALIIEFVKGASLSEHIKAGPLTLKVWLDVAVQLADALAVIHQQRIIHKDINPANIIFDPEAGKLKLIDFGIAEELKRDKSTQSNGGFEGTLAYISPEQTGRMNRSVDHRTDLYSAGISLYEALAGARPFGADDPLEMVHQHIAARPLPLESKLPGTPRMISKIVDRLLSKTAEDRYQSAAGLASDLRICRETLTEDGGIANFKLGQRDVSERFAIPERLYGREAETERLLRAFERVGWGGVELILVAGYSGVGKSRLVAEIQKPIVRKKGYFVTGKFDQFKRDVPLASLTAALSDLVKQILTESEVRIVDWRARMMTALGAQGQVIVDVIPELEALIGTQPKVPELSPVEAQNRFQRVFRTFFEALCDPSRPLCMFLDDLQWADTATMNWLEDTIGDSTARGLFLIAAYRDNEVDASHPMMMSLARVRARGAAVETLELAPLTFATLTQLVADALCTLPDTVADLAKVVYAKTDGNPFFVTQLLHSLHEQESITFNPQTQAWAFDVEAVSAADISSNVVELMERRIRKLEAQTQDALKLAACIGNTFDLNTLAIVSDEDRSEVRYHTWEAAREGLLLEVGGWGGADERFKFLHDRVQQAAREMLSDDEVRAARLKIGRLMLKDSADVAADERLFDIANHLLSALSLIDTPAERLSLVPVMLAAARRARRSAAFEPSRRYAAAAAELLKGHESTDAWLAFDVAVEQADCEHLCSNDDLAEQLYNLGVERAVTNEHRAVVYEKKVHFYTNLARFELAYAAGRDALLLFGVRLPAGFVPPLLIADVIGAKAALSGKDIASLVDLPAVSDDRLKTAIRLMAAVLKAAYQIKPELSVHVGTKMVRLCLKHGNTAHSALGFMVFGCIFTGGVLKNYAAGYEFGRLALALVDKYEAHSIRAEVRFVVGYFANSWTHPAAETETLWQGAYEAGLDIGDNFHASCACSGTVQSLWMRGVPLAEVLERQERFMGFLKRVDSSESIGTLEVVRQAIRNLTTGTRDRVCWDDDGFDEAKFIASLQGYGSRHFAHYYYVNKALTLLLWGEIGAAYDVLKTSATYLGDSVGMLHMAEHHFLCALVAAQLIRAKDPRGKKSVIKKTAKLLDKWAARCPANFESRRQLVRAELDALTGKTDRAATGYDAAIADAAERRQLNIEGIANELAAQFHLAGQKTRIGRFYLQEAKYCYDRWGAKGYAESLAERYPGTVSALPSSSGYNSLTETIHSTLSTVALDQAAAGSLDLTTVVKASEAISGEVKLESLLDKLLHIVLENAGAERGVLLLRDHDSLLVEAEGTLDGDVRSFAGTPLDDYPALPKSVINFVARSHEPVVLDDASAAGAFTEDPDIAGRKPRSVLCAPLLNKNDLRGVVYLENNLTSGAFTEERLSLITLLSGQIAISIDNALLYANLEEKVAERTNEIAREKQKSDNLLLNILPKETADELKATGRASTRHYELVTVLFTDFVGFTGIAAKMEAGPLVEELDNCFRAFDDIVSVNGLEKIKTIGDAYMCAGGIPAPTVDNPVRVILAALAMRDFLERTKAEREAAGGTYWGCRLGVHTGPLVAGVVGKKKFAYDVWGDTVNVASRMESSGENLRVNISEGTYHHVRFFFDCTPRGKVLAKGKGEVEMYFVDGIRPELSLDGDGRAPGPKFFGLLEALSTDQSLLGRATQQRFRNTGWIQHSSPELVALQASVADPNVAADVASKDSVAEKKAKRFGAATGPGMTFKATDGDLDVLGDLRKSVEGPRPSDPKA